MNTKFKAPCWVKHRTSGKLFRCRNISMPTSRMKSETGWKGLVLHVQNENGTGIMQYRDAVTPTEDDLKTFNERIKKTFGL